MITKKTILKHFDYRGKIHVIHNGLDKEFKNIQSTKHINKLKKKYNLDKNYKHLLHVGVPYSYKNVEAILKVLNKLPN